MTRATATFKINVRDPGAATELALASATLSPGQSVKLSTTLSGSTLIFGEEGANFLMWGNSAYDDPTRKEIGFIGKRDGPNRYHWLVYHEATNTWTNDRPVWDSAPYSGHGYDHNTIDPQTGTVYFRPYGTNTVRTWNGAWSTLPAWTQNTTIVGGLTWFPGVGLMYNDGSRLLRYSGGAWSEVVNFGGGSYHDISEYNSTANVMIFGGGNSSPMRKMTAALDVTSIESPPFTVGAGSSQGVIASSPSSAHMIAWQRATSNWSRYDIGADLWSALTPVSGNGSSPANGVPALSTNSTHAVIAVPIERYGVVMFVQYLGQYAQAGVWLYRPE